MQEEEISTIILDLGSYHTRIGFGGDDVPRAIFPSIDGKPKSHLILLEYPLKDLYVGEDASYHRSYLELFPTIKNGVFTSKDLISKTFHNSFYYELKTAPEDNNIVISEGLNLPKKQRETIAEILFEQFSVPGLHFEYAPVLQFYSYGKLTGTNLECGNEFTTVVSMVDGRLNPFSIQKHNIGGQTITEYLKELICDLGVYLFQSGHNITVDELKRKISFFSKDYEKDLQITRESSSIQKSFQLPDGSVITLNEERFKCNEPYYNPSILGFEFNGIDQMIHDSISRFNTSLQKELYQNIILNGGVTKTEGFLDRLNIELLKNLPKEFKNFEPEIHTNETPQFTAWYGGSILSEMSNSKDLWYKRSEYEEKGYKNTSLFQ